MDRYLAVLLYKCVTLINRDTAFCNNLNSRIRLLVEHDLDTTYSLIYGYTFYGWCREDRRVDAISAIGMCR
jgi:hypothetical protein